MNDTIRVMVVDDHEVVREGIASLLQREADIDVVALASSGEEALERLPAAKPAVVVLDYRLSGMSGSATCREIVRRRPATGVIMLTTYLEDGIIHSCLAAGARAYLLKEVSGPDLMHAVRSVARGESVLGPEIVDRVIAWARRAKSIYQGGESLDAEEIVVLGLVAQGLGNPAISRRLRMSLPTVKANLRSSMRKLGVNGRAEAVAAGIRKGVI